ncbi:MAG: glycosyltransferase family 4 protein [Pseudomonadota bacterium]
MGIVFIIPGDINTPSGGYRYDRNILSEWNTAGVEHQFLSLDGDFPFPAREDADDCMGHIEHISHHEVAVIDGLAGGVLPEFVEELSRHMPVVALVHHPLFLENGISQQQAKQLKASEQQALRHVKHVVTTSESTNKLVHEIFDYPEQQITAIMPGVERLVIAKPSGKPGLKLLCVGAVIERKGHRFLLEALSQLKHLDWEIDCVGKTDTDPALFKSLEDLASTKGLTERIRFHHSVSEDALLGFYGEADVFVLPSLFEGYGMAYAEAIVSGIPVIGTTAGAITKTVPETCGILVTPGDSTHLAAALKKLISDADLREALRMATHREAPNFPNWNEQAAKFANLLKGLK